MKKFEFDKIYWLETEDDFNDSFFFFFKSQSSL